MFLDGTFVRKGHYRVDSTGNPALISKSLINEFLKIPAFHDNKFIKFETCTILAQYCENIEYLWS